ncbi:MAG: ethanolamine ammonia-lyase reactivating factor EutA [Dehalococcoidia bacterium]
MNDFEHDEKGHVHAHEEALDEELEEEHPLWARDRIELRSVGIDIGSSTSHLMFSRLVLRRMSLSLSSKFQVVSREVTHESPIIITPFLTGDTINTEALGTFISEAYSQAQITPEEIDTGAVIVTGEAARKDNAEAIAAMFSQEAGKFVCATAGPNLEAKMAAYGSGAVGRSLGEEGEDLCTMNVDVGGGTSKIAIIENGAIVDTAAMNVGARLVVLDEEGRITRIEEAGRQVAEEMGENLQVGQQMSPQARQGMARLLAESLFNVLERKPPSPLTRKLMITPPLSHRGRIDLITFSGGVSEYIYGAEDRGYGDLGALLAAEVRSQASRPEFGITLENPVQRIRATVIGASQYTVQVSGSTIFVKPGLLPLRNLQVLTPRMNRTEPTAQEVATAVGESFQQSDLTEGEQTVVLAFHWPWGPAYPLLKSLTQGLMAALRTSVAKGLPVIVVLDADIGRLVGNILAGELGPGYDIISIDGIALQDFDYIDIGEELSESQAVPVVIKSLIFRHEEARLREQARPHQEQG